MGLTVAQSVENLGFSLVVRAAGDYRQNRFKKQGIVLNPSALF